MSKKRSSPLDFENLLEGNEHLGMGTVKERSSSLSGSFVFTAPEKKITVEETHIRRTWLIRTDLVHRLDRLAAGQGKGYATQIVNQALEFAICELERGR